MFVVTPKCHLLCVMGEHKNVIFEVLVIVTHRNSNVTFFVLWENTKNHSNVTFFVLWENTKNHVSVFSHNTKKVTFWCHNEHGFLLVNSTNVFYVVNSTFTLKQPIHVWSM
jgi:hypothetical protein